MHPTIHQPVAALTLHLKNTMDSTIRYRRSICSSRSKCQDPSFLLMIVIYCESGWSPLDVVSMTTSPQPRMSRYGRNTRPPLLVHHLAQNGWFQWVMLDWGWGPTKIRCRRLPVNLWWVTLSHYFWGDSLRFQQDFSAPCSKNVLPWKESTVAKSTPWVPPAENRTLAFFSGFMSNLPVSNSSNQAPTTCS